MNAKPRMQRITGACLLIAAAVVLFLWFYWLAPFRTLHRPAWWLDHTPRRQWQEIQKWLRRSGIDHDSAIALGRWGNKEWVGWLMTKIKPGQELDGCFNAHLGSTLASMTNQRLGNKADAWLMWWTTNRNKTQLEWIRSSFASESIDLQQPLTTNNIIALVKLVVPSTNSTTVTSAIEHQRGSLRYNALRWLRDSDFKPREFDFTSVPAGERDDVTRGLVTYALWLGEHRYDPGGLSILGQESDDESLGAMRPVIERFPYRWLPHLIIIAMAAGGIFLLRRASKRETHSAGHDVHQV